MKKECELCKNPARISCESDQASLCWDCDNTVHGANFLVEKHVRCLLCHVCQSPTPWMGSGPKLCHTISVCESCVKCNKNATLEEDDEEDEDEDEEDEKVESQSQSEEEYYSEDEGENQVVPWSSTPPPPAAESSEEECSSEINVLKRRRDQSHDLEDETMCCSSSSSSSFVGVNGGVDEMRSTAVIRFFKRLQRSVVVEDVGEMVGGIRRLSRDPTTVDYAIE